ncbi:hypothetical protein CKAH01_17241 [Colletotrichum kahawae]|uniref:Uncharacterized protein n=1 Tax=Colletotrichum kahawae TaxID=34407 RepID=A0AAD9YB67_COLKA|nr:hypothetical protein CKAH01_17241 [Colletotrichum kahawae]
MRLKRRAEKRLGNRELTGETRVEISCPPSFFSNQARIPVEPSPTSANFQLFQLPSRRPLVPSSNPRRVSERRTPLPAQPAQGQAEERLGRRLPFFEKHSPTACVAASEYLCLWTTADTGWLALTVATSRAVHGIEFQGSWVPSHSFSILSRF